MISCVILYMAFGRKRAYILTHICTNRICFVLKSLYVNSRKQWFEFSGSAPGSRKQWPNAEHYQLDNAHDRRSLAPRGLPADSGATRLLAEAIEEVGTVQKTTTNIDEFISASKRSAEQQLEYDPATQSHAAVVKKTQMNITQIAFLSSNCS